MASLTASDVANKSTQTFVTALVSGLAVAGVYFAIFLVLRYVFVRYLYLMLEIFVPFWIITWAILMPVDDAGSTGTSLGIEKFTFGNVGLSQAPRYAAHLIIVYILTFWVFYLIKRELAAFVILRQDFLLSRSHAIQPQARTVLVTGVAKEFLTPRAMTKLCNALPGGVSQVWLARNMGDLPDLQERCTKACGKLESAETKLLKLAAKNIAKHEKASNKAAKKVKDRPHHKLGFFGLWGKKVETISWAREEIATTRALLDEGRAVLAGPSAQEKYPAQSAAFIAFDRQIAAHMFAQCLAHHAPLRMAERFVEVEQQDVIWSNLTINPYQAKIRYALSWALTLGLIILWSFPAINGIIQGDLPPAALAILFLLLPIVLRLLARFEGIPLKSHIELSLMTRYTIFLTIHGFLIVTLASGLVAAIPAISKDPGSAVTLLATKLPAASTFFLTYFVTTALAGASGALLQVVTLILYYVKLFILGSTPRSVYKIKFGLSKFPNMTLLATIGLTYSVIAPLISGFAACSFGLFYFVYKYLFLYVYDTPPESETGGLFYPKALSHIFVGLYIEQVCMAGLFFLARDDNNKASSIPEGALMIVLIVITIFFQLTMNAGYEPLIAYLPLSLAGRIEDIQREGDEQDAKQMSEKNGSSTFNLPTTIGYNAHSHFNRFCIPTQRRVIDQAEGFHHATVAVCWKSSHFPSVQPE
ncbi:hypothetical protein RQP46_005197 [Phenoliferia psychrophenolica]